MRRALCVLVALASALACTRSYVGSPQPSAGDGGDQQPSGFAVDAGDTVAVLVGAGDVAQCGSDGAELTAHLIDSLIANTAVPLQVFLPGDAAYPRGSSGDFTRCYDPTWGRFKSVTRPVPGNHEYKNGFLWFLLGGHADPYFTYFDAFPGQAGDPGDGWYHYVHGGWDVYALNSGKDRRIRQSSWQGTWLAAQLAADSAHCAVAYVHHPLFGAGKHGDDERMRDTWDLLTQYGVDILITGHEHSYQRYRPQTSGGQPDPTGIRQIIVGTGGAYLHDQSQPTAGQLDRWTNEHHGVLKLTLRANGYDWEFIVADGTVWDRGSSLCQNSRFGS
jgi:alkaline phosphatase